MTSIINAATGGVTFTGGTTAELAIQAGGSTAAAFNTNGLFFRNRIINGDMRIDQRNAGAAVTVNSVSAYYPVDRFYGQGQGSDGVYTLQRSTTAPTGFTNSIIATVTTADASIGAAQYYTVGQSIEGTNLADLGWGAAGALTVTLSFWVRSSVTGTFGGALVNNANNRSYPFTYVINSANTFEYKTITIPGDTSGTWPTDTGRSLQLHWSLGVGSTYSGTASAWAGALYLNATGSTNLISTLNATWYITGVQLETGSVATPFERRLLSDELMRCYRYFETSLTAAPSSSLTIAEAGWLPISGGGANPPISLLYRVQKRATPTFTIYAPGTATFTNYVREGDTGTYRAVGGSLINQNSLAFGVTSGAASAYYQCGYAVAAEL